MPDENLDVVRKAYEAWNERDLDAIRALVHDDVVFVNAPSAVEPGTREGVEAFARVGQLQWEGIEDGRQEIERLEAAGDRVLVVSILSAGIPGSDARLTQKYGSVVTLRAGRIARMEMFDAVADAERALSG
jgi:ketosteroid isomerase-like protein